MEPGLKLSPLDEADMQRRWERERGMRDLWSCAGMVFSLHHWSLLVPLPAQPLLCPNTVLQGQAEGKDCQGCGGWCRAACSSGAQQPCPSVLIQAQE